MDNLAQKINSQQAALYQQIQAFSLDQPNACLSFTQGLAKDNRWTLDYAQRVIQEYKKFTFLAVVAGHPVAPSDQVDQAWHLHLTDTRSYWGDFCPNILQKPFHHEASRGGVTEQVKIHNWYQQTLVSYREIFGQSPPPDIWPNSQVRFGRDLHFRRINTQQNWIIPKPTFSWPKPPLNPALIFALSLMVTGVIHGCQGQLNVPNPLNFNGPDFLKFYSLMTAMVIAFAAYFRFQLRLPDGDPSQDLISLNTYETAYLAGGKNRVVDTAIVRLVEQEVVTILDEISRNQPKTLILLKPETEFSDPIERAVVQQIQKDGKIEGVRQVQSAAISNIEERLRQLNLLVNSAQVWKAKIYPALLIAALLALGGAKIFVGLTRDKPVFYLSMLWLLIIVIGYIFCSISIYRSRYGEKYFQMICRQTGTKIMSQGDPHLVLSFALFGSMVLANQTHEMLAHLNELFTPSSSGDGGGCGGDGGGCGGDGGGCGGGCGGCGGD